MTTQVIFKIDSHLKKSIQQRAAKENISLTDVFKFAGRAYAEGQMDVRAIPSNIKVVKPTKRDLVELAKAREDFKNGKYRLWSDVRDELDRKHKIKG